MINKTLISLTKRYGQLSKIYGQTALKYLSTESSTCRLVSLSNRSLVQVYGKDSSKLLQGLITNDMDILQNNTNVIYSMFLNVQGRTEYDILVYRTETENKFLIECDKSAASDMITLMKRYKLRSKVKFDIENDVEIFCLYNNNNNNIISEKLSNVENIYKDPRLTQLGFRVLSNKKEIDLLDEIQSFERADIVNQDDYMIHRYNLGISEGIEEVRNSIPLEHNLTLLNGVSYTKGCYIGQELVARAHHTGVIRKRLMSIVFSSDDIKTGDTILNEKGKRVGKVAGCHGLLGIGVVRLKEGLDNNKQFHIVSSNGEMIKVKVHRPEWWPSDIR